MKNNFIFKFNSKLLFKLFAFTVFICSPKIGEAQSDFKFVQNGEYLPSGTITANTEYGGGVLMYNNYMVTSSPNANRVFIQTKTANGWTNPIELSKPALSPAMPSNARFGAFMAMNDRWLMISAFQDQRITSTITGAVYLYENISGSWVYSRYIVGHNNGRFANQLYTGIGLAITDKYAFIGVPGDDSSSTTGLNSTSSSDNYGSVMVYDISSGNWVYKTKIANPSTSGASQGYFGTKIVCNNRDLFISATGMNTFQGEVYQFKLNNSWVYSGNKFTGPANYSNFGDRMSMYDNLLAISAPGGFGSNPVSGQAFVYKDSTRLGDWSLLKKFTHPVPTVGDLYSRFGLNVWGDLVVIGDPTANSGKGAIDIFKLNATGFDTAIRITNSKVSNNDRFGDAVGIYGNRLAVGAIGLDNGSIVSVGSVMTYISKDIVATDNQTDGFVDVKWRVPTACAQKSPPVVVYMQLYDSTNQTEIYSQKYDYPYLDGYMSGNFRHFVKPSEQHVYQVKLYQYGIGKQLCPTGVDTGSTLPFIKPNIQVRGVKPEGIHLSISNNSTYATNLNLYRDGKLLTILSPRDSSYDDMVNQNITGSIVNGKSYSYCLMNIKSGSMDTSGRNCATGSTALVNLSASDNLFNNKVQITWNNMSSYCDAIILKKDGIKVAALNSSAISYDDLKAIPGFKHVYTLELLNNNVTKLALSDSGSIKANGVVSGYVLNKDGGFGLSGVTITLKGKIGTDSFIKSTVTNSAGYYQIGEVYYHTGANITVSAKYGQTSFTENNKLITLNANDNVKRVDFESKLVGSILTVNKFQLKSFNATPSLTDDKVNLTVDYTCNDSIQVVLKRNNLLMETYILNPSSPIPFVIEDISGLPGEDYIYSIDMFYVKNGKYIKSTLLDTITYPKVLSPVLANISTDVDSDKGIIKISWTHSSTLNTGMAIYRNGVRIGDYIGTGNGFYIDYTGDNGKQMEYELKSYRVVENSLRFESDGIVLNKITYPTLKSVSNLTGAVSSPGNYVKLNWNNPTATAFNYNYSGIKIVRLFGSKADTIAVFTTIEQPLFIDRDAPIGSAITYKIFTYKKNWNLDTGSQVAVTISSLIPPFNLVASSNLEGTISTRWGYNHASCPIDGFRIIADNDTGWLKPNELEYYFALPSNYNTNNKIISLQAFRKINNVLYFSSNITVFGRSTVKAIGSLPAVTKLTASQNLPYKNTISWEYPSYYQVEFRIYKMGSSTPYAILKNDARTFNDLNQSSDMPVLYQVQPYISSTNNGRLASVISRKQSNYKVIGSASNIRNGQSVANARVMLFFNQIKIKETFTDSSGYYEFASVDFYNNFQTSSIMIEKPGHVFEKNQIAFSRNINVFSYTVNFKDTLQNLEPTSKKISIPKSFIGTPNIAQQSVILHWTSDGNNYTGFQIYRGFELIKTIVKGEVLNFEDMKGAPGTGYSYRIKSYWEQDGGIITESDFVVALATVPDLLPCTELRTNPLTNHIQFSWDHPNDMHTYYEVKRNDVVVAKVTTHNTIEGNAWLDKIGVQNLRYNYEVTSVLERDGKIYRSTPVSISAVYPDFQKLAAITYAIDSNLITLNWAQMNPSIYLHSYFNVYRNGVLLSQQSATSVNYNDLSGIPNKKYRYEVRMVYVRNGTQYESKPASTDIIFPLIARANAYSIYPVYNPDGILLSFGMKNTSLMPENYDFEVYRQKTGIPSSIVKLKKEYTAYSWGYIFIDNDPDAIPRQDYTYFVASKRKAEGQWIEGSKVLVGYVTFPALPLPKNIIANVDGSLCVMDVSWDYDVTNTNTHFEIIDDRTQVIKYIYTTSSCNRTSATYNAFSNIQILSNGEYSYRTGNFQSNMLLNSSLNECAPSFKFDNHEGYSLGIRAVKVSSSGIFYSNYVAFNPSISGTLSDKIVPGYYYIANSFTASDNDINYPGKVHLRWQGNGNRTNVKEFKIYRDKKFLATVQVSSGNNSWYDFDDDEPIPGKKHLYTLDAISTENMNEAPVSDFGSVKAIGQIKGNVLSLTGGNGISGVTIRATAKILSDVNNTENNHTYTTVTDQAGDYLIDNVYFNNEANYTIEPVLNNHVFDKSSQVVKLEQYSSRVQVPTFYDKTAITLSGIVKRKDACTLDSIKVKLKTTYKSRIEVKEEEVVTTNGGKYSFVFEPTDPDLNTLTLSISDTQTNSMNQIVSINDFVSNSNTWSSFTNNSLNYDFEEQTLYPIKLVVRNSCGSLGNYKFQVKVKSVEGCFEKYYTTGFDGKLDVMLPPYDYTAIVTGVSPENSSILPVVDYLSVRPMPIKLKSIHFGGAYSSLLNGSFQRVNVEMVYHTQPDIKITGITNYLCNNPSNPILWKQDNDVKLNIYVKETHGTSNCDVSNGFLIVKNAAATNDRDTLNFDPNTGLFEPYQFVVGEPMNVSPYTKPFIVEYHSFSDGFIGELINRVVVTGEVAQDGSDVIVQAKDGQDFKVPLMVLRDPPGDQSYSYIEKGTSISTTLSISDNHNGYVGVGKRGQTKLFGIGAGFDLSSQSGGGSGSGESYNFTVTTNERIETPSSNGVINADNTNFLLGSNADVIVGAGLALKYGINERIEVDNATCSITKTSIIAVSPDQINTTWIYTVDQIKKLITDFRRDSANVDLGTYSIEGKTPQQTKSFLGVQIKNWESVLRYHFKDNLPFVALCNKSNYDGLAEPFKTQADQWLTETNFCSEIGSNMQVTVNGVTQTEFVLKENLEWTPALLTKYNKLSELMYKLTDKNFQEQTPSGMAYTKSAFDNLPTKNVSYGASAENITFSGNTSIEKSTTVSTTRNSSFTQFSHFDLKGYVGMISTQRINVITLGGFGIMFGMKREVLDLESEIGITTGYNFDFQRNRERETTYENSTGYVLSDNDAGDQFSVTIIKGNDPMQTPYFDLLGGRSSCPPEPGTIYRDQPFIVTEDVDGNFYNTVQRDLDPGKPFVLPIKLMNRAPDIFNEEHYFSLSQVQNYNNYGAKLSVQGTVLGVSEFRIGSGGYTNALLQITRPDNYYNLNDIRISLAASCPNLDAPDNYTAYDLPLEMYFRNPCSSVSIVSPSNNWIIKKANPLIQNDADEKMSIRLGDYDLSNSSLESITLQYRRIGSNTWNDISTVSYITLKTYYEENKLTYKDPTYYYVWDIKNNANIVDGEYEIRAKANCGTKGFVLSEVSKGVINRNAITLFGLAQPSDGVLSIGDDVSVTFNNVILQDLSTVNYKFIRAKDSSIITATASISGKTILFDLGDLSLLDGELILASLNGVKDLNENEQTSAIQWTFRVVNNPLFWNPGIVELEAYQGSLPTTFATLINTSDGSQQASVFVKNGSWIQLKGKGIINLQQKSNQMLTLSINAQLLQPGVYYDTLIASVDLYNELKLPIILRVLPKPINWIVDPAKYTSSATVICNYNFDSTNVLSMDTLDKIGAFINGELRGVANIQKAGQYYRAYLNVYGNASDINKSLSFYIWHAKSGIEYSAKSRGNITFALNGFYGSTPAPRVLDVFKTRDSVRYVPLKKGWNYLALNTNNSDNSVSNILRSLHASEGDVIKTLNTCSQYDGTNNQWISVANDLNSISVEKGYLLYLNKADTLKTSGVYSKPDHVNLSKGWNLIGNPYQNNMPIDSAFKGSKLSNLALIKNDEQAGDYDSTLRKWNGINDLKVNKSYLLYNGMPGQLVYNSLLGGDDCSNLNKALFEYNMTFTASVKLNGSVLRNQDVLVRAFAGDECRGTSKLEYVESLDKYLMNLFVYSNKIGEKISFKIFSDGTWYDVPDSIVVNANSIYGRPSSPYYFSNQLELSVNNNSFLNNSLSIYPNPFTGDINVRASFNEATTFELQLFDNMGRLLNSSKVFATSGLNQFKLNTSEMNLPFGIYYIKLNGNTINQTVKVIKL